jgi:N-hydroxyarylamine O-acetyltransferase
VLLAIGFEVRPLSARVRYLRPRDYTPPRTHLFLRVELDGVSWLTDVGVGGLSLTAPIRLLEDVPQNTPHETRRIVRLDGVLMHQVRFGAAWVDHYEFTLEEMPPIDRELANWFTSTHPESAFKQRLTVARASPDGGRVTLLNRELTHRARDGGGRTHIVASPDELIGVLAREFGLIFPPETYFACPNLIW